MKRLMLTAVMVILCMNIAFSGEVEDLKKRVSELQKENKKLAQELSWLKELCFLNGVSFPSESGKYPIVNNPFFGIKLGDSFENIKKKYNFEEKKSNDSVTKFYLAKGVSDNVKSIGLSVYNQQIMFLDVSLSDSSIDSFNAVIDTIQSKYDILSKSSDTQNCSYIAMVDNQRIQIHVELTENKLLIGYIHNGLMMEAGKRETEIKKQELNRVKDGL